MVATGNGARGGGFGCMAAPHGGERHPSSAASDQSQDACYVSPRSLTGWSRGVLFQRISRKVRAPLGALPGNAWASPVRRRTTDSATENTPPMALTGTGKGEM